MTTGTAAAIGPRPADFEYSHHSQRRDGENGDGRLHEAVRLYSQVRIQSSPTQPSPVEHNSAKRKEDREDRGKKGCSVSTTADSSSEGDGLTDRARDEPHNEVRDPRRARSCAPGGRAQSVQGKERRLRLSSSHLLPGRGTSDAHVPYSADRPTRPSKSDIVSRALRGGVFLRT